MRKPVHNWDKLKSEFMETDLTVTLTDFIKEKIGKKVGVGGSLGHNTKGWIKERKAHKEALLNRSREMAIETMAKKEGEAISKHVQNIKRSLINMTNALQGTVMLRIKKHVDPDTKKETPYFDDEDIRAIKDIYPIIKTELGEASQIVQTKNELSLNSLGGVQSIKIEVIEKP